MFFVYLKVKGLAFSSTLSTFSLDLVLEPVSSRFSTTFTDCTSLVP